MPGTELICGQEWYNQHKDDYTQADIEALAITISHKGLTVTIPNRKKTKGLIENLVKSELEKE